MKLAVVIVHYNTSADLERCLESLAAPAPACEHAIVVVDNASTDPGLPAVRNRFGRVRWILNAENVGYARGVNQGLREVEADYYLVLNPDIVVQPGSIDRLLDHADDNPRAGIVGPQLLNEDGTIQDSCRRFYTFKTLLLRRTILGRLSPDHAELRSHLMRDFDHRTSRPVDWVLGGAMLVRRGAIERVGPMDERFFLYFEDVDWCYRMWQAGCEVHYHSDARLIHRHRRASARGTFSRSFWLHLASLISFYEKWGMLVWLLKKWRQPLLVLLSWVLDLIGTGAAFLAAYAIRSLAGPLFPEELFPFGEYAPLLLFSLLLVSVVFASTGRYAPARLGRTAGIGEDLQRVGTVFLLLLASSYLGHLDVVSRAVLLIFLPLLAAATAGARWLVAAFLRKLERGRLSLDRTLLVGPPGPIAAWLEKTGGALPEVDLVGYCAPAAADTVLPPLAAGTVPWLGSPADLPVIVQRYRILQVVFWPGAGLGQEDLGLWAALRRLRVKLRWHGPEVWLAAARARAEMFGGEVSAVQSSDGGSALRAVLRRLVSLAAGLVLALPAGLSRLATAAAGGRFGRTVPWRADDLWGYRPRLGLAVDRAGRVLPVWRQGGMAAALIKGSIVLFGSSPLAPPAGGRPVIRTLDFWGGEPQHPALTGPWAANGADRRFGALLRQFWQRPGGLASIETEPPAAAATRNDHTPGEEVTRS